MSPEKEIQEILQWSKQIIDMRREARESAIRSEERIRELEQRLEESKSAAREERDERPSKRFRERIRRKLKQGIAVTVTETKQLLDAIDTLEKERNDALRFADCWAKAETELNDMEIRKDAELRALEQRLAAAEAEPCDCCREKGAGTPKGCMDGCRCDAARKEGKP